MKITPHIHTEKFSSHRLLKEVVGDVILIVCSRSVYKNDAVRSVISELEVRKTIKLFTHVRSDAPFSDLIKIIEEMSSTPPTSIIAIGGGSVIDCCKALSVCFGESKLSDMFYKRYPIPASKVKLIAVPTTAGTGAEASFGAILYDDSKGVKGGLRGEILQPDCIVIDSNLYRTLPSKLMSEVGFDCLTHAVETYISKKSTPITRYQSVQAIQTVFSHLRKAVQGEEESISKMSIAACLMGINLAYSSTCLPHRIQYIIGPLTNTSHAQGLIALYQGWLALLDKKQSASKIQTLNAEVSKDFCLLTETTKLLNDLSIKVTLKDLGVKIEDLPKIAQQVTGSMENDPCYQDENTLLFILKESFE